MRWNEQKEQSAERCEIRGNKKGIEGRLSIQKIGRKNKKERGEEGNQQSGKEGCGGQGRLSLQKLMQFIGNLR